MSDRNDDLRDALKRAASALKATGPEFALAGSYALWVYGGPEPVHDVDFVVSEADVEAAVAALQDAGFHIERTPEDWLFKAWDGDTLVDVIFRPVGADVDDAMFERAEEIEVQAIRMKVMSAEDILVTKLLALTTHHLDYDSVLEVARSLREQIDWDSAADRTEHSPYAKGFFTIPHFDGYAAVLVQLDKVTKKALRDALVDGWLAVAPRRLADQYLGRADELG